VFVLLYTQERGRAVIRAARAPQSVNIYKTRSSFSSRIPVCQSGDAGAIPAGRTNFEGKQPGALARDSVIRRFAAAFSQHYVHALKRMTTFSHAPGASLRSRESKSQPAPGSTETARHLHKGPSFNRSTAALQAADAGA
jgi:hypothetical protein